MATYDELLLASENPLLRNRVRVACVVSADTIRAEDPATVNHALRLAWAKKVFDNPAEQAQQVLWSAIVQNRTATLAQITGSSDAAIQTAVDAAVSAFL